MSIEDTSSDQVWLLHMDGSSTTQGSGAGIVITSPQVFQIPREEDIKADCLSKLASALEGCRTRHITIQYLPEARALLAVQPIIARVHWKTPIIRWVEEGLLPDDRWEAARLKARVVRFLVQADTLCKRSYTHPLLRCLSTEEGAHSGCCGAHADTWTLANKALRARFFWPTMKQEAKYLVCKCERCKKHSSLIDQPAEPLTTTTFTQWRMDIVGPFPMASSQRKFLLVAIDYFIKWVEAEPLARITEGEVMKFIWKSVVCRFGIPREIISDNRCQFQGQRIQELCQGLHIKQRFTSVAHPQSNGQVEVTNRILVQGIKRRLERVGGNWTEELTSVLWAYRTTPRGSTRENPFSLVYGLEAIIPAELGTPSHRILNFSEDNNKDLLKENLDLIEELREKAFIRTQRYKNTMINSYNKRVKARSFQVGDLVLRRVDTLKPVIKLDPTWEGPYKIMGIIGRGAYELEDLEGRPLPRPWNIHISKNTTYEGIPPMAKRPLRIRQDLTKRMSLLQGIITSHCHKPYQYKGHPLTQKIEESTATEQQITKKEHRIKRPGLKHSRERGASKKNIR
ncbi:UNVERIFIED_CONTAM: hypothetical protein Sradi_1549000 [Sesamum radiatum]|uniref:Integrase catalytic domain-containing protein n=1 Tax=Sesamum radiatum TaxID=300843 RepID=A0AAW2U8M1_SESRA